MKARADDMIYWVPPDYRGTLRRIEDLGLALVHPCPTAVLVTQQRRDQLDPMALGECRWCGGQMPVRGEVPA